MKVEEKTICVLTSNLAASFVNFFVPLLRKFLAAPAAGKSRALVLLFHVVEQAGSGGIGRAAHRTHSRRKYRGRLRDWRFCG